VQPLSSQDEYLQVELLNGFDVLYDADGGYAGFRRR
jgi:hypothetical protein